MHERSAGRRVVGVILVVMSAFAMFGPVPAFGQEDGGTSVATTLRYEDANQERQVAQGVTIVVTDADGTEIGSGQSDADGLFELAVPGAGEYILTIDPATLPEGVGLRDVERTSVTVSAQEGQIARGLFQLVAGDADEGGGRARFLGTSVRQLAQLTLEGVKLGLFLAISAIGLSLLFGTTGLVNFAHGEMIGFGVLIAYFFNFYGLAGAFGFLGSLPAPFGDGVNLIWASMLAVVCGGALGWLLDRVVFGPLRRRGVSLISAMVVSIGLSIFIRYVFLFAFGGNPRFYRDYTAQRGIDLFGLVTITPKDLVAALISLAVLIGVGFFLNTTKMGKAMRAVADNRDLAESSGIDVQKVINRVWVASGALAALGGVFVGLSEQVSWNIGFRILLLIFAGVVLGGLGTAYGALVGCLIVGIGVQVSTIWIPTELKNVGALVVLIIVLVFRPQGVLGQKERIG